MAPSETLIQYTAILHALEQGRAERLAHPDQGYPIGWLEHWDKQIDDARRIIAEVVGRDHA